MCSWNVRSRREKTQNYPGAKSKIGDSFESVIILILIRTLAVSQRRVFFGKSFLMLWWGFGLVACLAAFGLWILTIIYHQSLLDPRPILFQAALTIAIFPFASWFFAWINQKIFSKI